MRPLNSQPSPWGCSSAGRALRSQCRGQGFDPPQLHHNVKSQPLSGWDFFCPPPSVGANSGAGLARVNEVAALDRQIGDAVALDREQLIPCVAAPLTFKRPLAASADTQLTTSASQSSPKWHLFLPAFELACLALGQIFPSSKASDSWLINIQRQYSWLALPCPHGRWPKSHRQTIQRQMPVWEKR